MKLANFPKTFGIEELAKGHFPHLFNKKENENYVGPILPASYYNPNGMNPKDKEAFMTWHTTKKESNYVFNFKQEIVSYCHSDVDILHWCCMEFRELFYNVTNIYPFRTLTIASACHLVYRTNYLPKDTIGIIPPMGYSPKNNQSVFAHKWLSYTADKDEIYIQHATRSPKSSWKPAGIPRIVSQTNKSSGNDIFDNQGIQFDPAKISYNPGLRALTKLMLNSFWGKFAQRPNLTKTKQIDEPQVFFHYLTSDEITVLDANLVSDEIIEIQYEHGDKFVQPNPNTNVVIAAFTTAHARLKLYDELDMLQERVLYYDTDSVIYLSQPGQPEPRLGNYIGDLTNELGGEHITVFASGGPKNYCYKTSGGKTEVKVCGITLDCTARQKVNFEVICALVFLRGKCGVTGQVSVEIPFRITRNTQTKEI